MSAHQGLYCRKDGFKLIHLALGEFAAAIGHAESKINTAAVEFDQQTTLILKAAFVVPGSKVLALLESAGGQRAQSEYAKAPFYFGSAIKGIEQERAFDVAVQYRFSPPLRRQGVLDDRRPRVEVANQRGVIGGY